MVGRDAELALIRMAMQRAAAERRPQLVTIIGPPGIGKSRLAVELLREVEASGGRRFRGRCLPYAEQSGYQASVQHIREIAGILESDAPREARAKLVQTVAGILPADEVADVTSYLSLVIGLGIDPPVERRQPLFYAVRRLMEAISREGQTLFVFEDLHGGDPSQFELLGYLCQQLREVPVTFVITARPEIDEKRPRLDAGDFERTTMRLEPLSPENSAELVRSLGEVSNAAAVIELAGGNPLFLEELAAISHGSAPALVPTNVREAISAHLDALPNEQRAVLLDA